MLLKLLKYEVKSSYARFVAVYAAYSVFFAITMIFLNRNSLVLGLLFVVGVVGLPLITFLTIFQRYNANLYGNEGYLMFTLPVSGKKLLFSKILSALIWSLLVTVMSAVYILIFLHVAGLWGDAVWELEKAKMPSEFWISLTLSAVVGFFLSLMEIYFSISVAKLPVWRKFGVVMGIVTYFVTNTLPSLPFLLFANMFSIHFTGEESEGISKLKTFFPTVNNFQTVVNLVFCFALFFATSYLIERRTSLK